MASDSTNCLDHNKVAQSNPKLPSGMQARIERDPLQEHFFGRRDLIDHAVLDFPGLRSLDMNGVDATSYLGPEVNVISSTIGTHDRELHNIKLEYEACVVERVAPAYHIGFDGPVYKEGDMDEDTRKDNIESYLKGIHWLYERFTNKPTTIVPTMKGTTPEEYRACYNGFRGVSGIKDILDGQFAVYAGQYFGVKGGGIRQLEDGLWAIDATCKPNGMFLVGYGSPWRLERFPGSVRGIAGLQHWIKRTDFRNVPLYVARQRFRTLRSEIDSMLGTGYHQLSFQPFGQGES
jgi:hypothetical protein